jgi:predicted N-acyltransferase
MKSHYQFSAQPNMVFDIREEWHSEVDYIQSFSKKYRDQYKRSRKKLDGIEKRKLNVAEIILNESTIYNLYEIVAKNAPFNTFFLAKNHFRVLKEQLGHDFLLYGYFLDEKLIGFSTLIKNGKVMDTYFLGYDEYVQKEKMLYLNMLYNMTKFGIENQFKKIIFGRTALEIKSSIGAKPVVMSGFIYHTNTWINKMLPKIFPNLEPTLVWQQRHPFKEI